MIDWDQMVTPAQAQAALDAHDLATLRCSPLQGRLTLGADTCAALDAMAADPQTAWATRQAIMNAVEWRCSSQAMIALGAALGYTPAQRLALFRAAVLVSV